MSGNVQTVPISFITEAVAVSGGRHMFDIFLLATPRGSAAFTSKQPAGPGMKP